jgi:hypothetical protein
MIEQQDDDAKTCGNCSEPFKGGEVAVQAARYQRIFAGVQFDPMKDSKRRRRRPRAQDS